MTSKPMTPLDQAVRWTVRFESGSATEADRRRFAAWRAENPAHAQAWTEVQGLADEFGAIPDPQRALVHASLEKAARSPQAGEGRQRRGALKLLCLGAGALLAGGACFRVMQLSHRELLATAAGERRSIVLPDGTRMRIDTASQAEVTFGPLRRSVHLHAGQVLIDTGSDPQTWLGKRDFWVYTRHARLQAVGTRFSVRVDEDGTRLHVSGGQVAVHGAGGRLRLMHAGETVRIPAQADALPQPAADDGLAPDAWSSGALVVRQMALPRFLAELSRYHAGPPIEADASVARLAVSGVFHLDVPDPVGRALAALQGSLPVQVERAAGGRIRVRGNG